MMRLYSVVYSIDLDIAGMASHNRLTVKLGGIREQGYSAGMHLTVDVHP